MKALELDDNLAEAHASLSLPLADFFWDFHSAERELRRAVELRPNYAVAYHWYALLLTHLRRLEEAYAQEKRAIEIDPYSRIINMGMANFLALLGKTHEAIERYSDLIELNPDFARARILKSNCHAFLAEYDAAIEDAKGASDLDKTLTTQANLARIYALAGKREDAQEILNDITRRMADEYVSPVWVGLIELALERTDEGFRWLEKGLAERDSQLLYFSSFPWFKDYRSDPKWKQISEKLGLPQDS